ncbi:unnamed protein product [Rhizopus stolonifer]
MLTLKSFLLLYAHPAVFLFVVLLLKNIKSKFVRFFVKRIKIGWPLSKNKARRNHVLQYQSLRLQVIA